MLETVIIEVRVAVQNYVENAKAIVRNDSIPVDFLSSQFRHSYLGILSLNSRVIFIKRMDGLKAMKAKLGRIREGNIRMDSRLIAAQSALLEKKRLLSECKAIAKLVDDLVDSVFELGGVDIEEHIGESLDEEIVKRLTDEALREFEVLNTAQSSRSRPTGDGNIVEKRESNGSGDQENNVVNEALQKDGGGKDGAKGSDSAE
ncbi:hypothetical protein PTKIN_Ptkin06aG0164900 [Pterospermum kingtungense]